ncbi:hypothetical protein DTO027B5_4736 [Paecilomyces variotii]|nr:hypothetical protein DTO027B3_2150 [Paecilomyces variotii]KAJ9333552.1 hypothetical protein DTO027B5_4736 [Paecilomyces variotii]
MSGGEQATARRTSSSLVRPSPNNNYLALHRAREIQQKCIEPLRRRTDVARNRGPPRHSLRHLQTPVSDKLRIWYRLLN